MRELATVRNLNKLLTKGVASKTAGKICGALAVVTVAIDVVENIQDEQMGVGEKILASELDIIAAGLMFCGPVGIAGGCPRPCQ